MKLRLANLFLLANITYASSSNSCGNDPRFRFIKQNESLRTCNWLSRQNQDVKNLFCEETNNRDVFSEKSIVKDYCREACDNCPLSNPAAAPCGNSAGKVPVLLNGQSKNKYCSWFLKKNRRDRYCEDPKVTEHCPMTCGTCAVPPQSDKCTIVAQTVLSLDEGSDDTFFECILDPIDAGGEENAIVPIQISDAQKEDLLTKFNTGELLSGESALALDDVGTKISGRGGILVQSNKEHVSIKKTLIRGSSRRLASTKGDKPILVIRVTDSEGRVRPESADQISDDIFGTFGDSNTLKSQMSDCSFGQLNVTAGVGDDKETSPGVIDITIDIPLVGASRSTVRRAVTNEAASFLGHSLPGPYQQVMIVLEKCYTDCGWAAYAYANSWLSVYQGSYYKMVGVQMHGEYIRSSLLIDFSSSASPRTLNIANTRFFPPLSQRLVTT